MTVHLTHPDGMLQQSDYAPVAVASGSRTVYLAGQAGVDPDFRPAASDLAGQVHAALRNILIGVRGVGGTAADLARLTFYVVDWKPEMWDDVLSGVARAQEDEGLPTPAPPITLIGVQALFTPEFVVEIEAIAVVD